MELVTSPQKVQADTSLNQLVKAIQSMIANQIKTNQLISQGINNDIAISTNLTNQLSNNGIMLDTGLNNLMSQLMTQGDNHNAAMQGLFKAVESIQPNRGMDETIQLLNEIAHQIEESNKLLDSILQIELSKLDACEELYLEGTATTTPTIYDFTKTEPNHPIRGYVIKNEGAVNLNFIPNEFNRVTLPVLKPGETFPKMYNQAKIDKLLIKAVTGTCDYRLWLLW